MPDIPVWRMSSPLKLSEYISAGLATIGPKHAGNCIEGEEDWSMMSEREDWGKDSVGIILEKIMGDWDEIVDSSLISSKRVLWSEIADSLSAEFGKIMELN